LLSNFNDIKHGECNSLRAGVKLEAHIVIKRGTTNHFEAVIEEDPA
jgi:hypothetical protein